MVALLLLGKLSQGSAQAAKCLAGEVLDAVIGLVVNDDGRDEGKLTSQALASFNKLWS